MKYTFKPYHILYLIPLSLIIWAFLPDGEGHKHWICNPWCCDGSLQGMVELVVSTIIVGFAIMVSITKLVNWDYKKEIYIPLPKFTKSINKDYSYLLDGVTDPEEIRVLESVVKRLENK